MESALGDRPVTRLVPYLEHMAGWTKVGVVRRLVDLKKYDTPTRKLFLRLVQDGGCRETAIEGLRRCRITEAEAQQVELLLTRKTGELRRGVLGLLESQKDPAVLASADRLLAAKNGLQRLAGLEMLRRLVEGKRLVDAARERGRNFQAQVKKVSKEEQLHLDALLDESRTAATLEDALGLLDHAQRTKPVEPKKKAVTFCSKAAREILLGLDALIHKHREQTVFIPDWRADLDDDDEDGTEKSEASDTDDEPAAAADDKPKGKEDLLGNITWSFPEVRANLSRERDLQRLPLREVWEQWWSSRPAAMRDKDGLETLRALWLNEFTTRADEEEEEDFDVDEDDEKITYFETIRKEMLNGVQPVKVKYQQLVKALAGWLLRIEAPKQGTDFLLDGLESALARIPNDKLAEKVKSWNDKEYIQRYLFSGFSVR